MSSSFGSSLVPAFVPSVWTVSSAKRPRARWIACSKEDTQRANPTNCSISPLTPLSQITFRNRTIYIKRDDLLSHSSVQGSKLRKFWSLLSPASLLPHDLLVSYGGAQSNAMVSLAALAHFHSKPLVYITRPLPPGLCEGPGNFSRALSLGMKHISLSMPDFRTAFTDTSKAAAETAALEAVRSKCPGLRSGSPLFIPQGGAWPGAEAGVKQLADELRAQVLELRRKGALALRKPILFLAAGTGTTAFYLNKHLADIATIVTVPVSGDERYLVKQMRQLASTAGHEEGDEHMLQAASLPSVLRPRLRGSFADIRPEKLAIWREMCRAAEGEFEFDLVYAPKAWEEVMLAIAEGRLAAQGEDLIYYHSGGVEGNGSMLSKLARSSLQTSS